MSKCDLCEKDMLSVTTCVEQPITYPDGKSYPQIPFGKESFWTEYPFNPDYPCHDCAVNAGGFHHDGCDVEECPRCNRQLISCGCLSEDEE